MARHACWNCDYRFDGDPARCPRCSMPIGGNGIARPVEAVPKSSLLIGRKGRKAAVAPVIKPEAAINSVAASAPAPSRGQKPARTRPAVPVTPAKVEIMPPRPPEPSRLDRLRSGAGAGLRFSVIAARKVGALAATASKAAAIGIAKVAGGAASGVRSTATSLVASTANRRNLREIDNDTMRRENARTISDVAEILLREAREENARLAARVTALEAANDGGAPATKPAARPAKAPTRRKPAPAAAMDAPPALRAKGAVSRRSARLEPAERRQPDPGAVRPVVMLEGTVDSAPLAPAEAPPPLPPTGKRPGTRRRTAPRKRARAG